MQRLNYEVNAHRTSRLWILAISSWILLGAAGADGSKSTDDHDWLRQPQREDAGARISAAGGPCCRALRADITNAGMTSSEGK